MKPTGRRVEQDEYRVYRCKHCLHSGHNIRRCPERGSYVSLLHRVLCDGCSLCDVRLKGVKL